MVNQLGSASSLYLQQHAQNPVHWHEWGPAALAEAQKSDKPILVSIGYSACHWCHVMAHECFEDPYIADLMNRHFVCIKVDREERPDIDQIYMEAVQMLDQPGGWPLNVFCLPDGKPFFGGTYFPPKDRGNGMIPWPQVLMRVADFYKKQRKDLEENATAIKQNILAANRLGADERKKWTPALLIDAARGICGNRDKTYGGFGKAPKFPQGMAVDFLLTICGAKAVENDPPLLREIDEAVELHLRAMAHGGIFDQIGGGFARYSIDNYWLIPHFEKMLYDNAVLTGTFLRGWLRFQNPLFRAIATETITWIEREMTSPEGCFYSALDADSNGVEGATYVWTPDEVKEILGPVDGADFCRVYNITETGNFEKGFSNPALTEADFSRREARRPMRERLLAARQKRPQPARDTKHILAWNALMIRSLAEAGFYLENEHWFKTAQKTAHFIWENLSNQNLDDLTVKSVYYPGSGGQVDGFLHDYALFAEANLTIAAFSECFETRSSAVYLNRAQACADAVLRNFNDLESPGFFLTAEGAETPVTRRKDWFDNATPSGNSSLLHVFSQLYALTGDSRYAEAYDKILPAYVGYAERVAIGIGHALTAATAEAIGIAIIHFGENADLAALQTTVVQHPHRRLFIQPAPQKRAIPAGFFQLCVGTQCSMPTVNVEELLKAL